jgi:Fe-S cluster assembly protein SufD
VNQEKRVNPIETTAPARAGAPAPAAGAAPRLGTITPADLAALARRSGDNEFLAKRRAAAWAYAEKTPFPSRLEELWRRTDISRMKWDDLAPYREPHPAVDAVTALPEFLREAIGPAEERSAVLVQVDSETVYAERSPEFAKQGITFAPIAEAARLQPALVERWLGATVRPDETRFTALNAALRTGGAFLHVPAGVRVERPIRFVLSRQTPDVVQFPHVVVVLEAGAEATVIEEYVSNGEPGTGVCVGVTEHVVGDGASLNVATFQRWGGNVYHFGAGRVRVGRDGRFHWTVTALCG